ncbi:sugar kinase [bacterium]|nr:sugar kinase [candidate division CSSED10-310 bacterium]
MTVLVVGSVALDSVQTPEGTSLETLGGSAVYFSLAASHFTDVRMVAVVGSDFPEEHTHLLSSRGIDTRGLQQREGRTFRWEGVYEGAMNEAITLETQLNVFENFQPVIPPEYRDSDWVFLGNINPGLQKQVMEQIPGTRLVAMDTMNFWIQNSREPLLDVMKSVDLIIINETELRMLADTVNIIKGAKIIRNMGPTAIVVKRGEYGSALFYDNQWFFTPGYPEELVTDPTGAGDSFAGGFMGAVARAGRIDMETFQEAMIYGSVMASFNIQRFGPGMLTELTGELIETRFRSFQDLVNLHRSRLTPG